MRVSDLKDKKVVIWGTGMEGKAAARLLQRTNSGQMVTFIDEHGTQSGTLSEFERARVISVPSGINEALDQADIVIKSPGISLYHPSLTSISKKGTPVTSLLNLWFMEKKLSLKTILVTGTKGKSTTASLIHHALKSMGTRVAIAGNIGIPITDVDDQDLDFCVIETSSYQAANFSARCDLGVVTSLFPEHLDWHLSVERYYKDKLNLLQHARRGIISAAALSTANSVIPPFSDSLESELVISNAPEGFHADAHDVFFQKSLIGSMKNRYLARTHNLENVCTALAAISCLGLSPKSAFQSFNSFQALAHRQQEIGTKEDITFVDDSISTTPQSTIAALEAYADRPVTLIAGGLDRGIDYSPLVEYALSHELSGIICMGPAGSRIFDSLPKSARLHLYLSQTMRDAVLHAKKVTPPGGVILLSPAAPSYDQYKNFEERADAFAAEALRSID